MPPSPLAVYRCPQGHRWPVGGAGPAACPTCRQRPQVADIPAGFGAGSVAVSLRRPLAQRVSPARLDPDTKPSAMDATLAPAAHDPPFPAARPTATDLTLAPTADSVPFRSAARAAVPGYTVLGELGRGGMGVVYEARHDRLKRTVALKMVLVELATADELQRFAAEAEAVARLQHPNILQIYETGEHDGRPYLALEFVAGGTLKRHLDGGPQPLRPAAQLVEILARAVHSAHAQGVVHRDLKPANILLAAAPAGDPGSAVDYREATGVYGTPKVADFGLAKRVDHDAGTTRQGEVLGSPMYMAPEQARGQADGVDRRADVYALGAILYEALTGRPPFTAEFIHEVLRQVIEERPADPRTLRRDLPRDLEAVCLRCLEKDPRDRYATALDLADDLRRFLNGDPTAARPRGPAGRAWRWAVRNPVPASLLVTATTLLAAGTLWLPALFDRLVFDSAANGARQQAATLQRVWTHYGQQTQNARSGPPDRQPPVPAAFMLGLSGKTGTEGEQFAIYSPRPLIERDGPLADARQEAALRAFAEDRNRPAYPERGEAGGKEVLRLFAPIVFAESCVKCHHDREKYPTLCKGDAEDWEVGEVRGVLEVTRPLDKDRADTAGLVRRVLLWLVGGAVALPLACGLLLRLGRR